MPIRNRSTTRTTLSLLPQFTYPSFFSFSFFGGFFWFWTKEKELTSRQKSDLVRFVRSPGHHILIRPWLFPKTVIHADGRSSETRPTNSIFSFPPSAAIMNLDPALDGFHPLLSSDGNRKHLEKNASSYSVIMVEVVLQPGVLLCTG